MNAYTMEFLARDHIAGMVTLAEHDRRLVHVPESPPPGPRPSSRIAALARAIVNYVRPLRPLTAQPID